MISIESVITEIEIIEEIWNIEDNVPHETTEERIEGVLVNIKFSVNPCYFYQTMVNKYYILLQKSIIAFLFIFNQIAITRGIDLIAVKEEVTEMMDLLPLKWEDYHTRQPSMRL